MSNRRGFQWGKGSGSSERLPPQSVEAGPARQRERELLALTENQLCAVTAAVAVAIEEPYVCVSAVELRDLVHVHRKLFRLQKIEPDYVWRDGAVYSAHDLACVIKKPQSLRDDESQRTH